jgi:hypothetical protein
MNAVVIRQQERDRGGDLVQRPKPRDGQGLSDVSDCLASGALF